MKVVIAGGTGWLGSALTRSLVADGHQAIVLSRASDRSTPGRLVVWDGRSVGDWVAEIEGADAVVNLTGASIAEKRWSLRRKAELISSRLEPARALVAAVAMASRRPAVFVQGSAVGYYGNRGDETLDEDSGPGNDFLAGLVIGWEAAADALSDLGVGLVDARTAVVLGPGGGALPRLTLPFRWFVGGPIGSGRQWFPWVHVDDVVGLIRFAIDTPEMRGPVNLAAPQAVTMSEFAAALGRALHRPSWLPAPRLALRVALGEIADSLLASQRVVPAAAQHLGYQFREPELFPALRRAVSE